jgi:hypothetical protein
VRAAGLRRVNTRAAEFGQKSKVNGGNSGRIRRLAQS